MKVGERLAIGRSFGVRIAEAHRTEFLRVVKNPIAMATLGGRRDAAALDRLFSRHVQHWEEHGHGLWIWFEQASQRHLGHAGLLRFDELGEPEVELAYGLHPDAWGRGFATEIAARLVEVAFEDLGATSIVALTLPTNTGSRRVMEGVGLRYERDIEHAGRAHVLCRRHAAG